MKHQRWEGLSVLRSKPYTCGHCGEPIASQLGFKTKRPEVEGSGFNPPDSFIYICHHCSRPTYFYSWTSDQVPGAPFGRSVKFVPSEVEGLYEEARNCMRVSAHTAVVLCCRKLLMNVAVLEGAKEGQSFKAYVEYLAEEGHVPAKAKVWVDRIRSKGNEANHEIAIMTREDAEQVIRFSEMVLRLVYEYPAEADGTGQRNKASSNPPATPPVTPPSR